MDGNLVVSAEEGGREQEGGKGKSVVRNVHSCQGNKQYQFENPTETLLSKRRGFLLR